jgi:hypothetical protein
MPDKQWLWEGGGKAFSVCYKEKISEIGMEHSIVRSFGDECLVKINFSIKFVKRERVKIFYMF